jgi:hypothetical protein
MQSGKIQLQLLPLCTPHRGLIQVPRVCTRRIRLRPTKTAR